MKAMSFQYFAAETEGNRTHRDQPDVCEEQDQCQAADVQPGRDLDLEEQYFAEPLFTISQMLHTDSRTGEQHSLFRLMDEPVTLRGPEIQRHHERRVKV